MREKNGCDHDKDTIDLGESRTISMTTAKNFLSLSNSRTQTANVQKQVCTEVGHCEYAQNQAISQFDTLRRKLEEGGGTGPAKYEGLEKEIAQFNLQSGELPSQLNRIDISEDNLVDLWEKAGKLENTVEEFEQEAVNQESDVYTWFRDKRGFDDVPKKAQPLESVKEVANRAQNRVEEKLREEHDVSKKELETRVDGKEKTESATENESQDQKEKQTQADNGRRQNR